MNDKMKRSDYIAKDVLDLFEKYDLYWQPFYYTSGCSFTDDPWNQSELNPLYHNINENKDLVRNALLEVVDKNRDFFDKYACPFRRLLDIIYSYKGLSDYGKDLIEELYEKCRTVERERKLWIHDFIHKTVPQPGLNTSIESLKKFRNDPYEIDLNYDKSQMKIFMKKLREEYYNKFNKFKNFDETSVLTKELIRYAGGNTKYYFDPTPEHMKDKFSLFGDSNLEILLLAEKPEDAKEYIKQKDDEYIQEEEKEIEDLEIMSSAFSNNTTKKRGFLSRIFG